MPRLPASENGMLDKLFVFENVDYQGRLRSGICSGTPPE